MLRLVEQSAGAEVNVVADDKADFEIVFRMWTSDLGLSLRRLGLLELEDPVEFPGTLVEQTGRNQKTVELVFIFIVGVGLRL